MKRYMLGFAFFVITALVVICPQQGHATIVTDAVVELTGLDPMSKWVVKLLLDQIVGDHRGAATDARVRTYEDPQGPLTASFFGDTGLLLSHASDSDGTGTAFARNVLRGKICTASVAGEEAAANAALEWKGDVKWSAEEETANPGPLPLPEEVSQAEVIVTYEIADTDVDINSPGNGSFQLEHYWNGTLSFQGSINMVQDELPELTGDLSECGSQFSNTEDNISASSLTISDSFSFPISYSDFYSTREVTANLSGSMFASADVSENGGNNNHVPEPTTMLLLGSGLIGLAGFRRGFKR